MSHETKIALTIALCSCALAIAANAAEPATVAGGVATFGQLDELRSQNAVLAEEVKAAELRAKLNAGSNNVRTSTPSPAESRPMVTRRVEAAPSVITASSAQVQMVSGVGNALVAHIAMQNGTTIPARVGTHIAGLGVVRNISINEVVVANKKQTIVIPFAAEPVTSTGSAPTPSGMGMTTTPFPLIPSSPMPPLPMGMPNGVR